MLDNQIIQLFLPIIRNGLIAAGYLGVAIKQMNQPTQQGVNTQPTVYYYKISDHRYGFRKSEDVWDDNIEKMVHTEIQDYETTFQINALVIQNPTTPNQYTASDLVNIVAQIMQSANTINTLTRNNVGIYKITDIRNPYFLDDRDRFEASPSFDFTLTHKQVSTSTNPVIQSFIPGIYPI